MTLEEREKMKFYGYDYRISIPKPNRDKKNLQLYLWGHLNATDLKEMPYLTASEIVQSSQSFFESFFTPCDIQIVMPEQDAKFTRLASNLTDPVRLRRVINRYTAKTSPFDIPVIEDKISGVRSYLLDNIKHRSLRLKRYPLEENDGIIYKTISVKNEKTITTPFEYTHEIAHTQADAHVGSVTDYFNSEVLPIFMEKLHAYYAGSEEFNAMENRRLSSLYRTLRFYNNFPVNLEDYAYIESTIEAEILFDIFLSSDKMQDYILESIQNIFAGYDNLERLLDSLDITTNGSRKYDAIESNLSR